MTRAVMAPVAAQAALEQGQGFLNAPRRPASAGQFEVAGVLPGRVPDGLVEGV